MSATIASSGRRRSPLVLPDPPVAVTGVRAYFDAGEEDSLLAARGGLVWWADLSGNGFHLTRSVASGYNPTTGAASQNGLNVVTFAPTNFIANNAFGAGEAGYVFLVCNDEGVGSREAHPGDFDSDAQVILGPPDDKVAFYGGTAIVQGSEFTTAYRLVTMLWDGADSELRVDRADVAAGDIGSAFPHGNIHLGSYVGDPTNPGYAWTGNIATLIVCGALSTGERDDVEDALAARWDTA